MKTLSLAIVALIYLVFSDVNVTAQTTSGTTVPRPMLRLKMSMDSINTDEILIRFDPKASEKYGIYEDGRDLGGIGALVSLSAFSSDNVALSIDWIPYLGLQQEVIPLFTDAVNSGTYRLEGTLSDVPALYELWLKDSFTGDSLNLRTTTTCQFTLAKNNPATFGSKRFSIVCRQNPDSVLSVLSFVASKNNNTSLVAWQVKNESDSTAFTVERSIDTGKTFVALGTIKSNGSGIYSFVDQKPVAGQNQYRLKVQDAPGNICYSKVVTLLYPELNAENRKIKVFPNPGVNELNLAMNSNSKQSSYSIRIVNTLGVIVKESIAQQANWHTDISGLRPGNYHIQVTDNTSRSLVGTVNFVKN